MENGKWKMENGKCGLREVRIFHFPTLPSGLPLNIVTHLHKNSPHPLFSIFHFPFSIFLRNEKAWGRSVPIALGVTQQG